MSESQHSDRSQKSAGSENAADPQKEKTTPRQEEQALSSSGQAKEVGGPAGPEPTRYGDWERKGRCIDF
jgi:hypothetical protein